MMTAPDGCARLAQAFLCTLTLCAVGSVCADVQALEEVEVTARRIGGAREVTEAVTSVSGEELERQSLQVVTDALRNQPGVFVQQTTPGQGTAIVRGLKGSEVLHLVDGMRLNNALFRNAPNQYLALVDPFLADRVDVVRGPLSTLYGSDAMGGVVQVVSQRPFLGGGDWRRQARAVLRYDSRTLGRTAHASAAAGQEALGFGGALTVQDHEDVRAADRTVQSPSAYRSQAASAFVSWRPTETQRSELSFQYLDQPSTPRFDELVAGFGQSAPASRVFRFEPNERTFVHAEHHIQGVSRWMDDIAIHAGWQRITDGRRTQDLDATEIREEDNRSDLFGLTLGARMAPGRVHEFEYGVDIYFDEVSSSRTSVDTVTGMRSAIRSRFPDGSTLESADMYVHDDVTLSEAWLLTAGLRVSRTRVDLAQTTDNAATTIRNTQLTGSLGLRYEWSERISVTANAGRGFRAPNIFDLGTLGARPGNRFNIANPDLQPEVVWTVDTGVSYRGDRWRFEGVAWLSDYFDQITSVSTGEVDAAGRDIVQSRNATEVVLYGLELASELLLGPWTLAANINTVYGRTTLTDGQFEPADRVPPINARLSLRYDAADWWVDSQWRLSADQDRLSARDISDPRIDPNGTPGFGVLDLRGGWQISARWRVSAEWSNLLDKRYREHGSGINGPGRAVTLTMRADW